jgi:ClpP class serine protease
MSKSVQEILTGRWFIEPRYAMGYLPVAVRLLRGEPLVQADGEDLKRMAGSRFADTEGKSVRVLDPYWDSDVNMEELSGTVAIDIYGPIRKWGGFSSAGTVRIERMIKQLDRNPNVTGIILNIESGGGSVNGLVELTSAIRATSTPVGAYVDDLAASAAYWIASSADIIFANNTLAEIGSIGVYTTMADMRGYFEKQGVKVEEIYSSLSSEKNGTYRAWLDGDSKPLIADLDLYASAFITAVKENRTGKYRQDENINPFKGALYHAPEAIEAGLIDGIGTMEELAQELAAMQASNNPKSNTMFGNKLKAVTALAGLTALTAEQVAAANQELLEQGVNAFLVPASDEVPDLDALVASSERLEADSALLSRLRSIFGEEAQAESFDLVAAVNTAVKDARFANNTPAPVESSAPAAIAQTIAGETGDVDLDTLAHNRAADEMINA